MNFQAQIHILSAYKFCKHVHSHGCGIVVFQKLDRVCVDLH